MLVLTRKSNQSIMIGDEIEVSVLSVVGEKVRIGIEAPTAVRVYRTEVYLEIRGEGVDGPERTGAANARKSFRTGLDDRFGGMRRRG
jgi:carbon storage regulator